MEPRRLDTVFLLNDRVGLLPRASRQELRHAHQAIGPYGYIKARRLEEGRRLIEAGTHPVGDVALLVGYENFGAFSTAFKAHFGRSPSSFRRGRERPGRRRA